MTEYLMRMLLWCTVINYALLLVWAAAFIWGRDFMFRLHSRWFKIEPEHFDAIHYLGMAVYKSLVLVFNIAPLLALWLTS